MTNRNPIITLLIIIITVITILGLVLWFLYKSQIKNHSYFDFKVKASKLLPNKPKSFSFSKNGPYIDTHFKDMNKDNPIGQTYYQRPITTYKDKVLTIHLNKFQPTVHANVNKVGKDILYDGTITITNFDYDKPIDPDSIVTVNASVLNRTDKELIGFHIHDGQLKDGGFTNFGPISYFLYTTKYWIDNAKSLSKEKAFPLPIEDATPADSYPLIH